MTSTDTRGSTQQVSQRLGRSTIWGAAIVCAVVALVSWFAYRAHIDLIEANRWTNHTYQVIAETRGAVASLRAAMSETRAVIAGNPAAADDMEREAETLAAHLDRLQDLTRDNPNQLERVREAARVGAECVQTLRSIVAAKAAGDTPSEALLQRLPLQRIREIAGIFDSIDSIEQDLLNEREADAERSQRLSTALLLAGSLTVFLVLAGSIALLRREGSHRLRLEASLRDAARVAEAANVALSELNARLEAANQGLIAANKELEAFTYTVSHDLRAPLRSIDGFSRILIEEHTSNLPPEALGYLKRVRAGAQQMGVLIDDLLTFSRLGRQPMRAQPVDLAALTRQISDQLKAEAPSRAINVSIDALPPVHGDASLLRQVMSNLLANAFKFTRTRDQADIHVGFDQEQRAFFVRDNGVGFDMRYADKLFGVFQRLHRADEFEGTGVGLAIVQRIIHRHGGRVWADGRLNEGAVFWFTLPGDRQHEPSSS